MKNVLLFGLYVKFWGGIIYRENSIFYPAHSGKSKTICENVNRADSNRITGRMSETIQNAVEEPGKLGYNMDRGIADQIWG